MVSFLHCRSVCPLISLLSYYVFTARKLFKVQVWPPFDASAVCLP